MLSLVWLFYGCWGSAPATPPPNGGPKPTVVSLIRGNSEQDNTQASSIWAFSATPTPHTADNNTTTTRPVSNKPLNQEVLANEGVQPLQDLSTLLTATPTPIVEETPTQTPTAVPTSKFSPDLYKEVMIFDDELDVNWTLEHSENVVMDAFSTARWFEEMDTGSGLHSGAISIAVRPEDQWNKLYITVDEDSAITYPRDDVHGISFWVNSGNNYLFQDALVVAIVGSNEKIYWSVDDKSVLTRDTSYFPEIPLYDMGVNATLPPNTWVRVILWMDQVRFGPEYINVTGLYIVNKQSRQPMFFIDKVALLMTSQ